MDTLIEIKLEKHKNLWEESRFFWGEIEDGTLKFDRAQVEVCYYAQESFQRNCWNDISWLGCP